MKKRNVLFLILFAFIIGVIPTFAIKQTVPDSFTLGSTNTANPNAIFAYYNGKTPLWATVLKDTNGNLYYCLDFNRWAARGKVYTKKGMIQGGAGFSYLMAQNPYVTEEATQKNLNITQLAVWLYSAKTGFGTSMNPSLLTDASGSYNSGVVSEAIKWYTKAKQFESTHVSKYVEDGTEKVTKNPDFSISVSSNATLSGEYYYKTIKINKNTDAAQVLSEFKVSLNSGASSNGVYIASTDGTRKGSSVDYSSTLEYRIYMPASLISSSGNKYSASVTVESKPYSIYEAYAYESPNTNAQRLLDCKEEKDTVTKSINLSITTNTGLEISKVDATGTQELAGAKLELYKCDTDELVDSWTSTTEPHYYSAPVGSSYYLIETQAPSGYEAVVSEQSECFTVKADGPTPIQMKNKLKLHSVFIAKKEQGTNNLIGGATLRIVDKATGEEKYRWVTSDRVPLYINLGSKSNYENISLPEGEYYVEEVATASNEYVFDQEGSREDFTITRDGGIGAFINGRNLVPENITIWNVKKPSRIKIAKVDAEDNTKYVAGARLQILDYEGKPIDGMEYTSTTSPIEVELDYGTYYLYETNAPSGYESANSDENPKQFEVKADGGVEQVIKIANLKKPSVIKVAKVDKEGNFVKGATFKILDKDKKAVKVTINGKEVEEFESAEDYITVEGLAIGEYYLEEVSAPEGYVDSEGLKPFSVTRDGGSVKYIKVTNEKTEIEISKIDPKGNYIKGAKLEILDEDGNTVQSFTSTDGPIVVKGLKAGKYYLKETEAPDGYEINDSPVEFFVSGDKKGFGQEISIVNDLTPEVPDTFAGASKLIYFIGTLAIVAGGFTLYKNKFAKARK